MTALYDVFKLQTNDETKIKLILDFDTVLGIGLDKALSGDKDSAPVESGISDDLRQYIEEKIAERKAAKAARDFALADSIRDELASRGITIKDTREGTVYTVD